MRDRARGDTQVRGRCNPHPVPSTHLGASLGETEDVVDEEQHVLTLLVPEVLGHRQPRQGHPGTGTRGLVHLPVHQGDLRVGPWGQRGVTVTATATPGDSEPRQGTQHLPEGLCAPWKWRL